MTESNKIIIHNYTDLEDIDVMFYVTKVIEEGKVSQTRQGKQYCFITTFTSNISVSCTKRNNTYRFDVFKEE